MLEAHNDQGLIVDDRKVTREFLKARVNRIPDIHC
jgi:hypothetical protein